MENVGYEIAVDSNQLKVKMLEKIIELADKEKPISQTIEAFKYVLNVMGV